METIFIILIAILATAGVYALVKAFNNRLEIFRNQRKFRQTRIADVDRLWNRVNITDKRLASAEDTLLKTSKLANNFDRNMDRYYKNINKDIVQRFEMIVGRIVKLETLQKEQGTSLFAHAEIIEDLRKKKNRSN